MKDRARYDWAFAIALAAMAYIFALSGGKLPLLVVAQGSVMLIAVLGFVFPSYSSLRRGNAVWLSLLSVVMFSAILFNTGNYSETSVSVEFALVHIGGVIGMLFALQWAATNLMAQRVLRNLAFLLTPLVMFAIAISLTSGGLASRQSPLDIHPNWWGELGFALTACALAMPRWWARAVPIAAAVILFVLVQSRGALLAAFSSIVTYLLLSTRWHRLLNPSRLAIVSALATFASVTFLVYQHHTIQAWLFIRDDILLWNNPYRGADSGLTGRVTGWQDAFAIFMESPIFGNGIDTLTDVHNGFLRLAGEGGLILLLTIGALIGVGLRNAAKARNYLAISIMLGYIIYAMTYPRMLNMNLAAVVFYLSVFPWKEGSLARLNQHPEPEPRRTPIRFVSEILQTSRK
jgi:O-antigen ligase